MNKDYRVWFLEHKIETLKYRNNKLYEHILTRMRDTTRYLFSGSCSQYFNIYFRNVAKIQEHKIELNILRSNDKPLLD